MKTVWIVLIAVISAAAAGVLIFFIVKKLRKKPVPFDEPLDKDILVKSGEQIKYNVRLLGVIEEDARIEERGTLLALREKLCYLSPSLKEQVHGIDEKIKTELETMRAKAQSGEPIGDGKQIFRLIAERALYTE